MAVVNSATADVGCGCLLGAASSFPSAVSPEGGSLAHVEAPPRCPPSQRTGASASCWFSSAAEDPSLTNLYSDAWRSCQFPRCVPAGCQVSTPQSVCACRLSRVCPPAVTCVSAVTCPLPQSVCACRLSCVCPLAVTCGSAGSHVCVRCHVSTPPSQCVSASCQVHDPCRQLWPHHFPDPASLSTWGERLNPESAPSAP